MHTRIAGTKLLAGLLAMGISGAAQAALHDRGGGLIYDDVLDVTWLQDANYGAGSSYDSFEYAYDDGSGYNAIPGSNGNGRMQWNNALNWAASLSYYDSVRDVTWGDWRLPHMINLAPCLFYAAGGNCGFAVQPLSGEMAHMFYVTLGNKSSFNYSGSTPISGGGLINTGPFINLQNGGYWYSTPTEFDYSNGGYTPAWGFTMASGFQGGLTEDLGRWGQHAWAVRDGDVGMTLAVPEADTWVMLLAGLGLVGYRAQRRTRERFDA